MHSALPISHASLAGALGAGILRALFDDGAKPSGKKPGRRAPREILGSLTTSWEAEASAAAGPIIHRDLAEQILTDNQADLIAICREILNNPNRPLDAALKLGVDGPFRNIPPQFGWWPGTRAKRGFGMKPSTWQNGLQNGLNDTRKLL